MRLIYRQNAQLTFWNRSQSRNRNKSYNNDYIRGRNREETIAGLSQGEEKGLYPNITPGLVLIMIKSGVIDVGNMTILHQNAPIPQLMRRLTMKKQIQPLYK